LVATIISGVFSLIHALATVSFRADHVVSGIAINFLALGIGVFLTKEWYEKGQTDMISKPFYTMNVPILSDIPVIGTILRSEERRVGKESRVQRWQWDYKKNREMLRSARA